VALDLSGLSVSDLDHQAAITRMAAQVGIRSLNVPSLEDVDKRKTQLWVTLSFVVLGSVGGAVGLLLGPSHTLLSSNAIMISVAALTVVFGAYVIEKERHLRRLRKLLLGERVLTTALTDRVHEIEALLDASRAVNSGHDLDTVLDIILGSAVDMLGGSGATVRRAERDETGVLDLVVTASHGGVDRVGERSKMGEGPAGRAARIRDALLLTGKGDTESVMAVPMLDRSDLIGVLSVYAPPGRSLSEYDLRAATVFAEHAASAMSKADLLDAAKRDAERLEHASLHDGLTGLANRSLLTSRVADAVARVHDGGPGIAVLFCDLDGFKTVNDTLGHHAGDLLLSLFAERLCGCLRGDSTAARIGGDEFAVLVEGLRDENSAGAVAHRIVRAVQEPFVIDGQLVRAGASIGISIAGFDTAADADVDVDKLLRRADQAMYEAKRAGGMTWRTFTTEAQGDLIPMPRPSVAAAPRRTTD
jgi:diguanylate cyclase (GGDEF)-like protein